MSDPVYVGYYTLDDATSMPDDARFLMYDPAGPGSYNITGALLKSQILASPNITGNLNFTGTGNRITGDFSNATIANRVMFQSSVADAITSVGVLPNGTATVTSALFYNTSNTTNACRLGLFASSTQLSIAAAAFGSGTLLPIAFQMAGTNQALLSTNGNIVVKTAAAQADDDNSAKLQTFGGVLERGGAGIGYGAGSGGQVVQATSKSTAVTLNKPTGQITTTADSLAAGQELGFNVNNSTITVYDTIIVNTVFAGNYTVRAVTGAGLFYCYVKNISAGPLSEAISINFSIIKGAIA